RGCTSPNRMTKQHCSPTAGIVSCLARSDLPSDQSSDASNATAAVAVVTRSPSPLPATLLFALAVGSHLRHALPPLQRSPCPTCRVASRFCIRFYCHLPFAFSRKRLL